MYESDNYMVHKMAWVGMLLSTFDHFVKQVKCLHMNMW